MMKKIFLLLIFILTINGHAQVPTYSGTINMKYSGTNPQDEAVVGFSTDANNFFEGHSDTQKFDITKSFEDIPFFNSCFLESDVLKPGGSTCQNRKKYLASDLIQGNLANVSTCGARISISNFKPNLNIKNQNPTNQNTVCSGEQLELAGFPIGFPDEAYHWQYSVDNKLTWIDVPSSIGSNPKTNNTPQTGFRVDEIIANSEQYFGQTIYFRLGYDQDRPFTDVIPIKYSPCAPVIKDRSYVGPDCNGEKIKSIDAFFETQLMPNESLSPLHLIPFPKTDGDTPKFLQLPVTKLVYDSKTGLYKYSFIIPDGEKLENRNYTIEYQARIINPNFIADPVSNPNEVGKYILRGVVQSSEKFLYEEHEALKFEPVTKAPPLCHNGEAFIELKVTGGAGDYYYTLDNEIEKKFTYSTTSVITTDPITKIETEKRTGSETIPISSDTPHSIKLRDGNNCIDKTAND